MARFAFAVARNATFFGVQVAILLERKLCFPELYLIEDASFTPFLVSCRSGDPASTILDTGGLPENLNGFGAEIEVDELWRQGARRITLSLAQYGRPIFSGSTYGYIEGVIGGQMKVSGYLRQIHQDSLDEAGFGSFSMMMSAVAMLLESRDRCGMPKLFTF